MSVPQLVLVLDMPPTSDHTSDIRALQALTTWLLTVPAAEPERVADDLTQHMFDHFFTLPGFTLQTPDLRRIVKAARRTESYVNGLNTDKENIDTQIQTNRAAVPTSHHHTRTAQRNTDTVVSDLEQKRTIAQRKLDSRQSLEITQMQLGYLRAYRAAVATCDKHKTEIRAEQQEEKKQERLQAIEARKKERDDQQRIQQQLREAAQKARADNEERSRDFNRRAADLNREYSKQLRQKRKDAEKEMDTLRKRALVLTAYDLRVARLDDPAAEPQQPAQADSAAQPADAQPAADPAQQ